MERDKGIATRVSTFHGVNGVGDYLTAKQLVAIRPSVKLARNPRVPAHISTPVRKPSGTRRTLTTWYFLIEWNETKEQMWCEEKCLEKYVGQRVLRKAQIWKLRYYCERPMHYEYGPLFFEQW